MNKLAALIRLIAAGSNLGDAWREAGFDSLEGAKRALEDTADSVDAPRAGGRRIGTDPESVDAAERAGRVEHVIVYTDGASRGNPGPSAIAAVAFAPSGERLTSVSRRIGEATNNVAEYRAVLEGLGLARMLRGARVTVRLDSELVARQLNGRYRVKSCGLRPLAEAVLEAASRFERCTFEHVPREENREADRLADEALDEAGDHEISPQ